MTPERRPRASDHTYGGEKENARAGRKMKETKYTAVGIPEDLTPERVFTERMMRRLVRFRYQCRLCGQTHEAENYVSAGTETEDEFRETVTGFYRLENMPEDIFDESARLHHHEQGDYAQLAAQARKQGFREITRGPELVITSESQYTCDGCRRTFGAIGQLREHGIPCPLS